MEGNVSQIDGGITINFHVSVKNSMYEKIYIWNSTTCSCKNVEYLASVMDDSVIICDDVIDADVNVEAKSNEDKTNFKKKDNL